ncbi:MAG TPA: class I SAM-dependent methyltransferase [Chthonomonadales bacterium]|nr:class I SAM-dependent methyltransferase [Chthonomonadales bacterium]
MNRQMLHKLLQNVEGCGFAVAYWDGITERYGDGEPAFTVTLHNEEILKSLRDDIEMGFGEGYLNGSIDVDGDLADLAAIAHRNIRLAPSKSRSGAAGTLVRLLNGGHRSLRRQEADVVHHYDLGDDFFKLWLDESMTYSCAYYRSVSDSLEQAQQQKIDHSLRKLRLAEGERLLDIGCGWGSVVVRAAERFGARAVGITLSENQYAAACHRIRQRGLDNADVLRCHYQEPMLREKPFDKVVSIGMIEHVGKAHLSEFVDAVKETLRPGGLALLHHITCAATTDPVASTTPSWGEKYIFPGSYIPSLPEMIDHITAKGFRILDVENLRAHYQLTLDEWSRRFEKCAAQIREQFGDRFVRTWRLYLRTASAGFKEGIHEVHQVLCSNGLPSALPLTREDVYG